jgi:hypothetical protein
MIKKVVGLRSSTILFIYPFFCFVTFGTFPFVNDIFAKSIVVKVFFISLQRV